MNYNDRLNFYLGNNLLNKNFDLQKHDFIYTVGDTDIKNIRDNTTIKNQKVFCELFKRTNNTHKYFLIHDNPDNSNNLPCVYLCKNRIINDNQPVLLRSFNFDRHWEPYYNSKIINDIPFDDKMNKIVWRGTTTGRPKNRGNRFQLVTKWMNKHPDIDVGFSYICQNKGRFGAFVKGKKPMDDMLKYKYILSVQGNDKDTGINWKLNSNSLVFMAKPTVTSWLMETTLIPNYHYILVKDDYSDLKDKLDWCNNNQTKCKEIVKNANTFMKQFSDNELEEKLENDVLNKYFELINK